MEGVKEVLGKINTKASEQKSEIYEELKCLICGKSKIFQTYNEYFRWRFDVNKSDIYLCSEKCKKEYKEKRLKRYYEEQGLFRIPKKFRNLEFRDESLVNRLIDKSVFITGEAGVGKTVLMASIVRKYLRKGYGYYKNLGGMDWISYPAFIMELQSLFRKDSESPFDYADEMAKLNGVLAIDDLGAEKLTDFVRQITYFIINEREQRELPILITSNFSLQEIDEMIDPRISSRIAGMCEVIKLSGKDRRLK